MDNPKQVFDRYQETSKDVFPTDKEAEDLYNSIRTGERRFSKVRRTEDTAHDIGWVKNLEEAIPHLQTIVDNPKSFIKSVNYLVPAELAKRTGPESVIHLATHSQYVKSIDKDGEVTPSKILTSEGETDVQIYENRFIMTLIKRLHLYIERRYVYLKHFASLQDMDIYYLDNNFQMGEATVKTTTTITVSRPAAASKDILQDVESSLEKVELMRKYVAYFVSSRFMREDMKGARPIIPPVMQTNMLRANPDYKAAYKLWLFLNEEEHASMDFIVNEYIKGLSEEEQQRLDFMNYLYVLDLWDISNEPSVRLTKNEYHATMEPNVDDLLFLNDKFSPFSLIRADQKYYDDLAAPVLKKVENKSPKVIDQAFLAEKKRLAQIQRERLAALALAKRKEKEEAKLRKEQEAILAAEAKKQKEEEEQQQAEEAKALAESLEDLRKQIKEAAKEDQQNLEKAEASAPEPLPEEAVEDFKEKAEETEQPKQAGEPEEKKEETKEAPAEMAPEVQEDQEAKEAEGKDK